jgi:O-antigen ligase
VTFRNIKFSVLLFIISFFVSPKVDIFSIGNESFFMRFDDLFILAISLVTLIRVTIKDLVFVDSPLNRPLLIFVVFLFTSCINGFLFATISNPLKSLFYSIKFNEFFFIFFFLLFYSRQKKDAIFFLSASFLGLILIAGYGIYEHFHPLAKLPYPLVYRIYERGFFYGQSNHFGGTFSFFISLIFGLLIFINNWRLRLILICIFCLSIFPFFWTFSRQAHLNLLTSLIVMFFLSFKKIRGYPKLVFFMLLAAILLIIMLLPAVQERISSIKEVILSKDIYSSSFAYRLNKWRLAFADNRNYLLLGTGLGSRHRAFYESQWVMFLSELGIIGTLSFVYFLFKIFRLIYSVFKNTNDNFYKGLSIGCLSGLSGLVVQSFVCNVFTVTVIAAPFYVILALILSSLRSFKSKDDAAP